MSARAPVTAAVPSHPATKDPGLAGVAKEVPDLIVDPTTKRRYERGKFLGKGGFAKCYELKDQSTGELLAGKIVPKSMLTKTHQKEKMSQVRRWKPFTLNLMV
jgi:polo-like kinase 1